METPKISLAYAAGFIDGDGSILVNNCGAVLVYATNSHREALEPFKVSFGGDIGPPIVDSRNQRWRPMNMWVKYIGKDAEFLRALEPHLLLKKRQAQIGIELSARRNGGPAGLPDWERIERKKLSGEIANLNSLVCTCPHSGVPSIEYLAGFFDAEGCVGIYRYKENAYRVQVNVANRCRWICDQYRIMFGGYAGVGHGTFQWQTKYRIAKRFLEAITPFLVLKQERAKNALSLYDHIGVNNGWNIRRNGVADVLAKKAIANESNRKGSAVI